MNEAIKGIEATLNDLILARPARGVSGFAPNGKVNTHQWGSYQSAFKGRGMEFSESRVYHPGDDVKNIDWRVTARTGETHTKLYQEERERPINILVDMRAMMQFGTRVRFKANLAAEIAAQLAWVGYDGGDRVGGHILTRTGIKDFRGARTRRGILRFLEALSQETRFTPQFDDMTIEESLSIGVQRLRKIARPGSLVFIISDFYDFDELTNRELSRLSLHAHVTLIKTNDALDKKLPNQTGRISDGKVISRLSPKLSKAYAEAYEAREQLIYDACARNGLVLHELVTSDDPRDILRSAPGLRKNHD